MPHRQKHFYVVLKGDEVEIRAWFEKQKTDTVFQVVPGSYLCPIGTNMEGPIVFPSDISLGEVVSIFNGARKPFKWLSFLNRTSLLKWRRKLFEKAIITYTNPPRDPYW